MRSVWPTAISTEPLCAQLTPSSAIGARRERRHPAGVTVAQKRATVLDPLENTIGRLWSIPYRRGIGSSGWEAVIRSPLFVDPTVPRAGSCTAINDAYGCRALFDHLVGERQQLR